MMIKLKVTMKRPFFQAYDVEKSDIFALSLYYSSSMVDGHSFFGLSGHSSVNYQTH